MPESFLLNESSVSSRLGQREARVAGRAVASQRRSVAAPQATAEGIDRSGNVRVSEGNASTQRMIPKDLRRAAIPGRPVQGTLPDKAGGTPKGVADLTGLPAGIKIQISSGDPLELPQQEDPLAAVPVSRAEAGAVCQNVEIDGGGAGGEDDSSEEEEDGGELPGGGSGEDGDSPKGGPLDPCVPGNSDTGCQWYLSPQPGLTSRGTATFGSDPNTTYYLECDEGGSGTAPPGVGCPSDSPPPNNGQSPPGTKVTIKLFVRGTTCDNVQDSGFMSDITNVTAPWTESRERIDAPLGCTFGEFSGDPAYAIRVTVSWTDPIGGPQSAFRTTPNRWRIDGIDVYEEA